MASSSHRAGEGTRWAYSQPRSDETLTPNMSTPTPAGGTHKPSTKRPPNWSWEDSKPLINSYKHTESTKMRQTPRSSDLTGVVGRWLCMITSHVCLFPSELICRYIHDFNAGRIKGSTTGREGWYTLTEAGEQV